MHLSLSSLPGQPHRKGFDLHFNGNHSVTVYSQPPILSQKDFVILLYLTEIS